MQRWAQANLNKLKQLAQEAHPDSKLAIHGKFYFGIGNDGLSSRRGAKEEAVAEREHDGPDH